MKALGEPTRARTHAFMTLSDLQILQVKSMHDSLMSSFINSTNSYDEESSMIKKMILKLKMMKMRNLKGSGIYTIRCKNYSH